MNRHPGGYRSSTAGVTNGTRWGDDTLLTVHRFKTAYPATNTSLFVKKELPVFFRNIFTNQANQEATGDHPKYTIYPPFGQ